MFFEWITVNILYLSHQISFEQKTRINPAPPPPHTKKRKSSLQLIFAVPFYVAQIGKASGSAGEEPQLDKQKITPFGLVVWQWFVVIQWFCSNHCPIIFCRCFFFSVFWQLLYIVYIPTLWEDTHFLYVKISRWETKKTPHTLVSKNIGDSSWMKLGNFITKGWGRVTGRKQQQQQQQQTTNNKQLTTNNN